MTYAAQEACGTSEDEPTSEGDPTRGDERRNRRRLVVQEALRDVEAARRGGVICRGGV